VGGGNTVARRILLGAVLGVAPLIAFGVPVTFGGFEMELSECASLISPDRLRLAPADNSLCTGTPVREQKRKCLHC